MTLDLSFVRSQYPVFQNPETARWAFFENAGGSYVPYQVIDRLNHFFKFTKVQPYGLYAPSVEAGEAMEAAYRCVRRPCLMVGSTRPRMARTPGLDPWIRPGGRATRALQGGRESPRPATCR